MLVCEAEYQGSLLTLLHSQFCLEIDRSFKEVHARCDGIPHTWEVEPGGLGVWGQSQSHETKRPECYRCETVIMLVSYAYSKYFRSLIDEERFILATCRDFSI